MDGIIGKIYTFNYHLGQHLRDWHKNADYTDYYAAKKESGGCKEMVIFELGWLSHLFGKPVDAKAFIDQKLDDPQITADDVYAMAVKFPSCTGTVLIDIVSRPAVRELTIVGEKGMLKWNWDNKYININSSGGDYVQFPFDKGTAAEGYHSAICEDMYISEMKAFIEAITPTPCDAAQIYGKYPYSREEEEACINILNKIEKEM
jgi:predicted dehydrogenase